MIDEIIDKIRSFVYVSWLLIVIFILDLFEKPESKKRGLELFGND